MNKGLEVDTRVVVKGHDGVKYHGKIFRRLYNSGAIGNYEVVLDHTNYLAVYDPFSIEEESVTFTSQDAGEQQDTHAMILDLANKFKIASKVLKLREELDALDDELEEAMLLYGDANCVVDTIAIRDMIDNLYDKVNKF